MSTIESIQVWRTSDNHIFMAELEARKHQIFLNFYAWYNDGNHLNPGNGTIDAELMAAWLTDNCADIANILNKNK